MLPSESMSSISIEVLVRVYCHCLQTLSYSRQSEIFFLQLGYLVLSLLNHAVVEFASELIRNLAHYQGLVLLL